MKLVNLISILASIMLMAACSNSGSTSSASSSGSSDTETEALIAAQGFIQQEFAADAEFNTNGTVLEPTEVTDRYKVLQRFDSEVKEGYNFVYRIWVQKFPSGWEYGNLAIENASGERVYTSNGRMKDLERAAMTRQEDSSADGVDYTIIKRNAPNYVRVYTPTRLNRDEVLTIYNQLKDEYEIVQYSTSSNPNDNDYMAIKYGSVYEYDKDKITKLAEY